MHARTTTFQGRPELIDSAVAHVHDEVLPAVERLRGCAGMSMLVERDSGLCVVTSAWRDREAMRASGNAVTPLRQQAQEAFGAPVPEVREWEIPVLHRRHSAPEGAAARVIRTGVRQTQIDHQLAIFRDSTLPLMEELPGYCSASLFVDRDAGAAVLTVVYRDAEALAQSRAEAEQLREAATARMAARILEVFEAEVAFAHLRVPETV